MTQTVYRVIVTREDDAWAADVVDLPGTSTWARNLPSLEASVREAIALALDLPEGGEASLDLDMVIRTGDKGLDRVAARLRRERAQIEARQAALTEQTATAAAAMARTFSVRDIARLLDISPQRVSQLTASNRRRRSPHAAA